MRDASRTFGRPAYKRQARREAARGTSQRPRRDRGGEIGLYPPNWPELSAAVRKRDGYRCQSHKILTGVRCDAVFPPPWSKYLHVHHIVELSKGGSNAPDNLLSLCSDCHGRVHNRSMGNPISDKVKRAARNWRT